jgi:short subunit dehydrogenase-like uncharacterized protein
MAVQLQPVETLPQTPARVFGHDLVQRLDHWRITFC